MIGSLKLVALDLGHTLMNEQLHRHLPIENAPIALMPGALAAIPRIPVPLAVWANTRVVGRNLHYHYLDLVPKGHDEGGRGPFWVRRRDEYDT